MLKTLRRQKYDPIIGKVWSQDRLANEANLSVKIIGDIERGRRVNLDRNTLTDLANALNLNTLERFYFHRIATGAHLQSPPALNDSTSGFLAQKTGLIAKIQLPAYIHDNMLNIIAANSIWLNYYSLTTSSWDNKILPDNLIRMLVDPHTSIYQQHGAKWLSIARKIVYRFRAYSMADMTTDDYNQTLSQLMAFDGFRTLWIESLHKSQQHWKESPMYDYDYLGQGTIRLISVNEHLVSEHGDFYLTTITPGNRLAVRVFDKLSRNSPADVYRTKLFAE